MKEKYQRIKSKTVVFRVTPEELNLITGMADVSGMRRQEYLLERALEHEIRVYPNPRMFKALKNRMEQILSELRRIEANGQIEKETLELIHYMSDVMEQLKGGD